VLDEAEKAEAMTVGAGRLLQYCDDAEDRDQRKAKRLQLWREEADDWLRLRSELRKAWRQLWSPEAISKENAARLA
jgi:hypothetical protein